MTKWVGFVLAVAVTVAAPEVHADKKKASEHFALAEQAEKRQDYQRAIDEYEAAYAASPHPAMLYNIARNYERLGQARIAAETYRRYLDESDAPSDRNKVEGRVRDLRARKSKLDIVANPTGALVFVDGDERGAAPLTVIVEPGEHEVYVASAGKTSRVTTITAEYGEPQMVRLDLSQQAGLLVVACNVRGAEVRLDGELIGHTPFSGPVTAGQGQLVVTHPDYQTSQRTLTIAAGGSQRIQVNMTRIAGAEPTVPEGPAPSASWLVGLGYGYDAGGGPDDTTSGLRYAFNIGARTASQRLEGSLVLGTFGYAGIGLESRVYFSTGTLRPYARGAALLLNDGSTGSDKQRFVGLEAGGGVLYAMEARAYRIGYFLEIGVQALMGKSAPADSAADESTIGIPVTLGLMYSFGGGSPQR